MSQSDIFRYCVAGFLAALCLVSVSVFAYAAWKDSKHGDQ